MVWHWLIAPLPAFVETPRRLVSQDLMVLAQHDFSSTHGTLISLQYLKITTAPARFSFGNVISLKKKGLNKVRVAYFFHKSVLAKKERKEKGTLFLSSLFRLRSHARRMAIREGLKERKRRRNKVSRIKL